MHRQPDGFSQIHFGHVGAIATGALTTILAKTVHNTAPFIKLNSILAKKKGICNRENDFRKLVQGGEGKGAQSCHPRTKEGQLW